MKKQLFFIAVLPGVSIAAELTQLKQYAADHFDSWRALRSPPHLTLIPPFWWAPDARGRLDRALGAFCREQAPFSFQLNGFDCFAPRVIFVAVQPSFELNALQGRLEKFLQQSIALPVRDRRPFHPHLTIAFKDLRRSAFADAWAYFSELPYKQDVEVRELALLRHRDKKWEVVGRFPLGGN